MSATDLVAQATAAGTSALVVSMIGVEPQALVWGVVGSILGVTLAKPAGRAYAMLLFLAATMTCALLGTALGGAIVPGSALVRNSCVVVIGAMFHPLLQSLIGAAPGIIEWGLSFIKRRFGGEA